MPLEAKNTVKSLDDQIVDLLIKFSIPLYIDDEDVPTQIGTGFIVHSEHGFFLVSAAHVLDDALTHGMYFYCRPSLKRHLSGKLVRSKVTPDRTQDSIDVGVLRLLDGPFPPYQEVDKFAMDISYLKPRYVPREGSQYLMIGYPSTKSKVSRTAPFVSVAPYALTTDSAEPEEYRKHALPEETHILLKLDVKNAFDTQSGRHMHFPKPQGMSGAPVIVSYDDNEESRVFPVVGVAIEHRATARIIVATDVRFVLEAIDVATAGEE